MWGCGERDLPFSIHATCGVWHPDARCSAKASLCTWNTTKGTGGGGGGGGGGCLMNDRKSVTWGEGNYTREAQKSFFSAFLHRTLGWSTIIRAWLHCCMTHTCTLDGFFFHNHYDLLGINSALQHHFQTFTVNQWQLDDNFGMASN